MRAFVLLVFLMGVCLAEESVLDGKVFVKSDPTGADVFLVLGDGKFDNLGKTPILVRVPLGKVKLLVQVEKHQVSSLELELKDTAIQKPDVVMLEAILFDVDVIFEEGWQVFVDKAPVLKDGKPVLTPATVHIPWGEHEVGLAKKDFRDIVVKVEAMKDTLVEVKDKPVKGISVLVKNKINPKSSERLDFIGKWEITKYGPITISFDKEYNISFASGTHSISSLLVEDVLLFRSSSEKEILVVKKTEDGILISAYAGRDIKLPDIKDFKSRTPVWTSKGIKIGE